MTTLLKNHAGRWKTFLNKGKMQVNKANNKKMLITGVSGLLGNNLARYFKNKYYVLGLYLSHAVAIEGIQTQKANLLSRVSLKKIVREFNPNVIIHCAALTDLDFCETNQDLTHRVNILGTKAVVDSIKSNNAILIYISSDSVYDGYKGNFVETDPINPLNYYGLSKYKGELEVLKKDPALILRTNIFGWNIQNTKKSLGEWILDELQEKRRIYGFKDAYFSSIYTFELAKILDIAIHRELTGIYNCGSSTSLSKYEFALRIAEWFKLDKNLIQPISIDGFNFKAKRGKNLTLNVDKLKKALNHNLPTISESLDAFCQDFNMGLPNRMREQVIPD